MLQLWDLRNQRAPKATLHGHSGGVLGLSWCQQDAGFLLSSGKDNRCGMLLMVHVLVTAC